VRSDDDVIKNNRKTYSNHDSMDQNPKPKT